MKSLATWSSLSLLQCAKTDSHAECIMKNESSVPREVQEQGVAVAVAVEPQDATNTGNILYIDFRRRVYPLRLPR